MGGRLTRRQFLQAGAVAAAGLMLAERKVLIGSASAVAPAGHRLRDIEHVVILIQENRSFDHYFGTLRGVRGFGDTGVLRQADGLPVFAQPGYPAGRSPAGHLLPFHLDTHTGRGECVADPAHSWVTQHHCWNGGRMDGFVRTSTESLGPDNGPITMGYYSRHDLAFYYALADAFTICDQYFCSALGPTDPNRLHAMSATIDPEGRAGGPVIGSAGQPTGKPSLRWTTMPERLQSAGVSWKVYASPETTWEDGDNTLLFFEQFHRNPQLAANAFGPTFPGTFEADAAAGTLPNVSWIIPPLAALEHAPAPPVGGEAAIGHLLKALTANPAVWAKTVLFITWDENGGFFDHVAPPVPPPGTRGEYVATPRLPAQAGGMRGPIGLGFRVPLLVVSPFARGGLVSSETFDHTSLLRFIETRFDVEVPNLSPWRRATTGDLTAALNFAAPDRSVPALPPTSADDAKAMGQCVGPAFATGTTYPPPSNRMPTQEPGTRRRPSGPMQPR